MRWAGDLVQYILDNPYTRGFQHAVDSAVIAPIERMVVTDDELRAKVPALLRDSVPASGLLGEQQIAALNALKGADVDVAALNAAVARGVEGGYTINDVLGDTAASLIEKSNSTRGQLQNAAAQLVLGRKGLTEAGDQVRTYLLGSPAAAYATGAAGLGLVGLGGYEAYQWLQQQAAANAAAQAQAAAEEKRQQRKRSSEEKAPA